LPATEKGNVKEAQGQQPAQGATAEEEGFAFKKKHSVPRLKC
jgi:hypothetical protein